MGNIIELNRICPYGVSNLNRDEYGRVKHGYVGGVARAIITSQCIKHALRKYFRERYGATYHTRYAAEILKEKACKRGLADGNSMEVWTKAIEALVFGDEQEAAEGEEGNEEDGKKDNKKGKKVKQPKKDKQGRKLTEQVLAYSDAELETVLDFIAEKGAENITRNMKKELDEILLTASVGAEIAVFGRMTTAGIGSTVASATHFNFSYSIDRFADEYDTFTAIDDYLDAIGETGAAHLDAASFASLSMYGYANADPVQVYKTLAAELDHADLGEDERKERERKLKEIARDALIMMFSLYLNVHPEGKQHPMATYPIPSTVYITVVRDGFPCTMDNAFNDVVKRRDNMPVTAAGARRMVRYITEDAPNRNCSYRAFCVDSTVREYADKVGLDTLPEDIHVYRMNEIETVLEALKGEIDDILANV